MFPAIGFGAETVPSPGYLDLDGTRYVKIPKSIDFAIPAGGTMTITMRVKQHFSSGKETLQSFVSTLVVNNGNRVGFDIYNLLSGSDYKTTCNFRSKSTDSYSYILFSAPNANFLNGQEGYIHIAVVFNNDEVKTNKSCVYLYSDGVLLDKRNMDKLEIPALEALLIGARYLCATGKDFSETEKEHFFNGQLDEVRFYRNALSQDEVNQDMKSETFISGKNILAAYDFSDLSDGVVRDISGKGHHGELMGTWPTYGPPSQEIPQSYTVNIEQNEHADITLSVNGEPLASG